MRTLAITQNITLDGSIEMLDDWFDAQGQGDQSDLLEEMQRQDSAADGFLCGRQTFTDLRGYWRDLGADDTTGVSDYLNGVAKYVVTRTLADDELDWPGTTALRGDVVEEVAALKQAEGMDIVCTGSIRLTHALFEAGLVDEVRLFVFPVVQGRGRRLFPDGFGATGLELVDQRSFRSGLALLRYRLG